MLLPVTHASTVFARSSAPLLSYLKAFHSKKSSSILLFALSQNAPDLAELVTELSEVCEQSVGCLSGPIPHPHLVASSHERTPTFSCSVALFPISKFASFRSTIAGKKEIRVGRSSTVQNKSKDDDDFETIYKASGPLDSVVSANGIVGLEGLPTPRSVHRSIIHFSDDAHQGFSKVLETECPDAHKLGLIASSTPFVTGRPFTLLHNGEVYSSGAVAVAGLVSPQQNKLVFDGLESLNEETMRITSWRGNLIHNIDNMNPARLLLDTMRQKGLTNAMMKENEVYVGVGSTLPSGEFIIERAYNVLSGDPARGMMALQTDAILRDGMEIKFYHRPTSAPMALSKDVISVRDKKTKRVSFLVGSKMWNEELEDITSSSSSSTDSDMTILENVFIASSENGLLYGEREQETSEIPSQIYGCNVPGAVASLEW